jgi:hypothetical protein
MLIGLVLQTRFQSFTRFSHFRNAPSSLLPWVRHCCRTVTLSHCPSCLSVPYIFFLSLYFSIAEHASKSERKQRHISSGHISSRPADQFPCCQSKLQDSSRWPRQWSSSRDKHFDNHCVCCHGNCHVFQVISITSTTMWFHNWCTWSEMIFLCTIYIFTTNNSFFEALSKDVW